jgi:hypothetical protein
MPFGTYISISLGRYIQGEPPDYLYLEVEDNFYTTALQMIKSAKCDLFRDAQSRPQS